MVSTNCLLLFMFDFAFPLQFYLSYPQQNEVPFTFHQKIKKKSFYVMMEWKDSILSSSITKQLLEQIVHARNKLDKNNVQLQTLMWGPPGRMLFIGEGRISRSCHCLADGPHCLVVVMI